MAAHDMQTKAAALADLLTGEPVSIVQRRYRVPRSTAYTWQKEACKLLRAQLGPDFDLGAALGDVLGDLAQQGGKSR